MIIVSVVFNLRYKSRALPIGRGRDLQPRRHGQLLIKICLQDICLYPLLIVYLTPNWAKTSVCGSVNG
jgi:hypothetical protein